MNYYVFIYSTLVYIKHATYYITTLDNIMYLYIYTSHVVLCNDLLFLDTHSLWFNNTGNWPNSIVIDYNFLEGEGVHEKAFFGGSL